MFRWLNQIFLRMSAPYMRCRYKCSKLYFQNVRKYWQNRKHKLHSNEVKEIDNFIQLMTPMLDQEEIDTELFILYYFYLMKLMETAKNKMNS
jgi:hypothetical protein